MVTGTLQKRLTKDEAQEAGLIPPHQTWDEEGQRPVPIGSAILADALARPLDLEQQLQQFKKNRDTILRFIKDYLVEAEYDKKGNPIPGKVGDYYKVPGSENKALTKRGSSKVNQLFRWSRGAARQVAATEAKDFCSATIEVPLVDQYGRVVGAGVASCNTAEAGFRGPAIKKYGGWGEWENKQFKVTREPDYRAAQNDIVARASKRASVQATIVAAAIEEVFTAAMEDEPGEAPAASEALRLPQGCGSLSGQLLSECPSDKLAELAKWLRSKGKATYDAVADAIAQELDLRRDQPSGEEFPG